MGTLPQMLQDRLILVQTGPLGFKLVVILFMAFLVSGDLPQTCLFYVFHVSRLIFFNNALFISSRSAGTFFLGS